MNLKNVGETLSGVTDLYNTRDNFLILRGCAHFEIFLKNFRVDLLPIMFDRCCGKRLADFLSFMKCDRLVGRKWERFLDKSLRLRFFFCSRDFFKLVILRTLLMYETKISGTEGIEPTLTVLKTAVLPLNYAPYVFLSTDCLQD